ncbi:outer membrane protein assembly factor BamA [Desulfovibrio ferrophilus]|uniref:Outer membrane protein assembly factor BamA n=1 Tax=Desulfovibrio ferrophilus TaxID=241368 RepID=A0A2Z6AV32_9BACT|nr:outer membrane protein assembly factor BamA [Desulfovibrio ferrophilus]BBD07055.1 outer membrane protein assembly factor BamA [Desulfovibrio ferrophilus]
MSKRANRFGLMVLLAAVLVCLAAGASVAQSPPDAGKIQLVILPFEVNADPELGYLKDSLPELLGEHLEKAGFSLVDQKTVNGLLEEHGIEYLDIATAKDLALLSSANWAVYGSFSQVGETISLDVRLVEAYGVQPAKPVFVVQEGLINVVPAIEDLAEKIRMELLRKERIEVIEVEGSKVLDKEVVLMRLRVSKGDIYDPKALNAELKNIYELGYFDDVSINVDNLPEGVKVTFVVKEKPRITVVDVLGVEELDRDDILELLNSKAGSVLNPKILADDLSKVKAEYRKEGYYNAKVSYELEEAEGGLARLNIVVDEGNKLYIENIRIVGAEGLDEDDLKDQLALSEHGMLSWFTGDGILQEDMLDRDSAVLQSYYGDQGYLEAKVGQPRVEFLEDGISVTFEVEEGRRYKAGTITYQGDLLETPEELGKLIETDDQRDDDEYVSRSQLRDDAQTLTKYYSDYGYAFAEVDYQIKPNPETLIADIVFELHKRQKIYIRRVMIEGNTRTRDNVIRREMRLTDGDLFSGSKLSRSTQRLNYLGFFELADVETVPTDDPSQMDLKVKVKETTTGQLTGGIGWSSADGVYFMATVAENNLFGKGYTASVDGAWGGDTTRYTVKFMNPHVYDSPWKFGVDIYDWDDDYDDYDISKVGTRIRTGHPIGEYTYWNAYYELENYKVTDVDDDATDSILDIEGDNWKSMISNEIVRNTLDRRLNPTSGMKSRVTLEYSGGVIGGSDDYIKFIADHTQYWPMWWDHVFHFHAQIGYVMEQFNGNDVPVHERFYLGGIDDVRGYKNNYISPREDDDKVGGNKVFFTNFEYLFPIMDELGVMGLAFFDAGEVWAKGDELDFDLKKSVGCGIRWYSPMGPLRLEYGYALDTIEEQGSKSRLEFSIGQFF